MRTIALIARAELHYKGQRVKAGAVFQAAPVDAAVLRYHRKVDFAPRERVSAVPPEPLGAGLPQAPDAVLTTPENLMPEAVEDLNESWRDREEDPEKKPRTRRRYQRRDLTPED